MGVQSDVSVLCSDCATTKFLPDLMAILGGFEVQHKPTNGQLHHKLTVFGVHTSIIQAAGPYDPLQI